MYVPGVFRVRKNGSDPLGLDLTDGCGLSCECWELNLSPLEKQLVLSTAELTPALDAVFLTISNHRFYFLISESCVL